MTIAATATGVRITLHIRPGASRTMLTGRHGDALAIRVAAPPVDGKANRSLTEFLAKTLAVPKRAVTLVAGASSRRKIMEVEGIDVATATARLAEAERIATAG